MNALVERGLAEEPQTSNLNAVRRTDGHYRFGLLLTATGAAAVGVPLPGADHDSTDEADNQQMERPVAAAKPPRKATMVLDLLVQAETGFAQADQPQIPALAAAYTDAVSPTRKMRPVPAFVAASGNVAGTPADAVRAAHGNFHGGLICPASRAG